MTRFMWKVAVKRRRRWKNVCCQFELYTVFYF